MGECVDVSYDSRRFQPAKNNSSKKGIRNLCLFCVICGFFSA